MRLSFRISGTGSCVPDKVVKNDDLAAIVDTSDEWIRSRTGIEERRVMGEEDSLLVMGTQAVNHALIDAGVNSQQIDLLICCSLQGDYVSPSLSCLIGGEIGIREDCITLDINMGCCGFIYDMNVAKAYFSAGFVKTAVLVSAESLTRLIDWTDRATCVLFGDASAAVVLQKGDNEIEFDMKVNGKKGAEFLNVTRSGDNCPYHSYKAEANILHMNGQEIYKFAVSSIVDRIQKLLLKCNLAHNQISKYLFHQANMRIINAAISRTKESAEKFPHNIERYGNTSSASIPLLLDELNKAGKLQRGERLMMCAFGAGLASAACVLIW